MPAPAARASTSTPPPGRSRSNRAGVRWSGPASTLALPAGFEGQIRPRSGLALDHGVTVLNSPGTVDSDYRGEIGVLLVNLGESPFMVERGMRIAQLVVAPVGRVRLVEGALPPSGRGAGGFGSTGPGRQGEGGSA